MLSSYSKINKNTQGGKNMADVAKALFKVIAGIILILIPIWAAIRFQGWGQATVDVLQAAVIIGVVLIGLLILVLGFTGFKE